jgi:hypothetical protein
MEEKILPRSYKTNEPKYHHFSDKVLWNPADTTKFSQTQFKNIYDKAEVKLTKSHYIRFAIVRFSTKEWGAIVYSYFLNSVTTRGHTVYLNNFFRGISECFQEPIGGPCVSLCDAKSTYLSIELNHDYPDPLEPISYGDLKIPKFFVRSPRTMNELYDQIIKDFNNGIDVHRKYPDVKASHPIWFEHQFPF